MDRLLFNGLTGEFVVYSLDFLRELVFLISGTGDCVSVEVNEKICISEVQRPGNKGNHIKKFWFLSAATCTIFS